MKREQLYSILKTNRQKQLLLLAVIGVVGAMACISNPFKLNSHWQTYELTVNYTFGFVRRGLLGTIVYGMTRLFSIEYNQAIVLFELFAEILFVTMLLIYIVRVMKRSEGMAMMSLILVALNPIGFYFCDWGEMDLIIISLTIVMLLLLHSNKCIWLIPILSCTCECIHEGYALMFFCIVFSVLFYKCITEKNKKEKIYLWTVLLITGLAVSALFVYFYFFSNKFINVSYEELVAHTKSILGTDNLKQDLEYVFFDAEGPLNAMWVDNKPTFDFYFRMIAVIVNMLVCSPLLCKVIRLWKGTVTAQQGTLNKMLYFALPMYGFLILPLVFIQTDEARWFYDFVFFQYFLVSSMYIMDDSAVKKNVDLNFTFERRSLILLLVYCLYYAFLEKQHISLLVSLFRYAVFMK